MPQCGTHRDFARFGLFDIVKRMAQSRMMAIRVLIADDHAIMRGGLRGCVEQGIDMLVIADAGDGEEAIGHCRELQPDICLLNLQMPRMDDLKIVAEIRCAAPATSIVVLGTHPGDARVARAIALGATAYLLRTATGDELLSALRCAYYGRANISVESRRTPSAQLSSRGLSPREIAVLRLAAEGNGNRAIGEALNISGETVKTRMKNVRAKLRAKDRTHAVMIALRQGFIDP
jgi:DNA-binding NarL/FixJ family response regulator